MTGAELEGDRDSGAKIFKEREKVTQGVCKNCSKKDRMWSPLGARASTEQEDFQGGENDSG